MKFLWIETDNIKINYIVHQMVINPVGEKQHRVIGSASEVLNKEIRDVVFE